MAKTQTLGLRSIAEAEATDSRRKLLMDTILEGLDGDDREWLLASLRDRSISHGRIVRILRKAGVSVSEHAVRSWRGTHEAEVV